MKKVKILQVLIIVWSLLFLTFSIYKLANPPPVFCYESIPQVDPVTKELKPSGGCSSKYGQVWVEIMLVFLAWLIIFLILLTFYLKLKRKS